jgi:hypothetical protein
VYPNEMKQKIGALPSVYRLIYPTTELMTYTRWSAVHLPWDALEHRLNGGSGAADPARPPRATPYSAATPAEVTLESHRVELYQGVTVSGNKSEGRAFFARSVPLKWVLISALALVVVMAAIVVAVFLVDRSHDNARRAAASAATSTTGVTSPYDLTELPADTDLDVIGSAAFVSIYVPNESGTLTSYGISSDLPAAQAITKAVLEAKEMDAETAASATGATTGGTTGASTMTFVLPTRETLTFGLNLEQGLIVRGSQTWRPNGDLKALVEAAVAGPQ